MNVRKRQLSRRWRLERLESRDVPSFVPFGTVSVGGRPGSVALADFNGDGSLDLLSANATTSTVSIRQGNGAGAFTGRVNYRVGLNPVALVADDFNRDGRADFAVASAGNRVVSLWLGNGAGGFSASSNFPLGGAAATPTAMIAADFDGDGNLDLAVAQTGGTVTLLAGSGAGSFEAQGTFAAGARLSSLAAADLNEDGRLDLIVTHVGNTVSLLFGVKEGFDVPAEPPLTAGVNPGAAVAGDFDRDGDLDLAVANSGGNSVSLFQGDGLGGFTPGATLTVGAGPVGIAAEDFDADGDLDLLVSNSVSNSLTILSGNGAGGFTALPAVGVGAAPRGIVLSDLNRDGRTDVVLASGTGSLLTVLRNNFPVNSAGSLSLLGNASDTAGLGPQDVALADLNNDGFLDAAVANSGSNTVTVRYGDGAGNFGDGGLPGPTVVTVGAYPIAIALADVNRDGLLDLIIASFRRAVLDMQPRLLWLSVSYLADPEAFVAGYQDLYHLANSEGVVVAVGGRALVDQVRQKMTFTYHGESLARLVAFAQHIYPARSRPAAP